MTEPTEEEIIALLGDRQFSSITAVREALRRWGQPSEAIAPVAPDFYTACAWYEGGGESGWIALPGYSNETEHGVKHLILQAARKEGYKGTITGRLMELGWEIRPVYLAPQPTQAQAGAVPLTVDEVEQLIAQWSYELHGDRARYLVRMTEQHHGIKGGQHGADI